MRLNVHFKVASVAEFFVAVLALVGTLAAVKSVQITLDKVLCILKFKRTLYEEVN